MTTESREYISAANSTWYVEVEGVIIIFVNRSTAHHVFRIKEV